MHEQAVKAKGRVRMQAVDPKTGRVHADTGWVPNLILNQGMNGLVTRFWADSFTHAAIGDSDLDPTKVSGGATTVSQNNVTVTLAGGSFTFTSTLVDAGKVIKFLGGHETTIVNVLTPLTATVNNSAIIIPQTFDVYQTTQTGLNNEIKRSNSYYTAGGGCATVLVAPNTVIMRRAINFPIETPVLFTYKEVGMSWSGVAGNNLFSRVIFPSPIDVPPGLRPRVFYELTLTLSPAVPTARFASIDGWPIPPAINTMATESLEDWGLAAVTSSGSTAPYRTVSGVPILANEPSALADYLVGTDSQALGSPGDPVKNRWAADSFAEPLLNDIYSPGSFTMTRSGTVPNNQANSAALRVFCLGHVINPTDFLPVTTLLFDYAQTKSGSYLIGLSFRLTWGRILS